MTFDSTLDHCSLCVRPRSLQVLCLIYTVLLLSSVQSATAQSQSNIAVKKELVWSLPDNEIASPKFSPDGSLVALVTRVHWPDGDEAESLPESVFDKLEQRKQREPRFADAIIRVIDLKGNPVCEARYGTNPRQKKPLTRLAREGACGMASPLPHGNPSRILRIEKCPSRRISSAAPTFAITCRYAEVIRTPTPDRSVVFGHRDVKLSRSRLGGSLPPFYGICLVAERLGSKANSSMKGGF